MADTAKFWDKMARGYAKSKVGNPEAYQAKLDHTQTFFTPETKLFEFACGTGTTALYHAPKVASVLATDVSGEMLAIAREKLSETDLQNVRFQQWNIETDALPDETFDVVMAHSILHLVHDLPATLRKTRDLLKPGGIFIASTVCLGDRAILFKPLLTVMRLIGKAPHVAMLKRKTLKPAIEAAGFELLDLPTRDWGGALFTVARKV